MTRGLADACILIGVLDESLREIMSVNERFRVDCVTVHGICLRGCDGGLLSAGGSVQPSIRIVQKVNKRYTKVDMSEHVWTS